MKTNMKSLNHKSFLGACVCVACMTGYVCAQDSTLNRNVTVERDFQPLVQSAGKIATTPQVLEPTSQPVDVHYSDYNALLSPDFNVNALLSQPMRFTTPRSYKGWLRGAIGHPNTLFDFGYRIDDQKNSILDVYATHYAQWGRRADSHTQLGFDFTHPFSGCDLYFGVRGANTFYTRYGRYYDGDNGLLIRRASELKSEDKQNVWDVDALVGVRSNSKSDIQYKAQVGYRLYSLPQYASEHQVRTTLNLDWHFGEHYVGGNVYVQNSFLQTDSVPDSLYNARHSLRIEPYYAYKGKRFSIHVGVNLDVNIGRGQYISQHENIAFAPSPQVDFEAQIAKKWLTLYGSAKGNLGLGTLEKYMETMPLRSIERGITSHHMAPYTPVDAQLGFHVRAHKNLLIDIYGGYMYQLNQLSLIATLDTLAMTTGKMVMPGTFSYIYSDYGRGKVGAAFSYHYQDIINIRLLGNYYFWKAFRHDDIKTKQGYEMMSVQDNGVYDRASWDIGLRVDGRIDEHWSLYSDNYFAGSRKALVSVADKTGQYERTLKPTIRMNIGCQYEMWVGKKAVRQSYTSPNLTLFLQLNNYIHRHNDIYYGYQTEGVNFLMGATYRF